MPIHKLKLLDRRDVAKETVVFTFEKPTGLTFKPGQYAGLTLINPSETDAGGITRRFSLLSTPDDEHILIATRIQTSAYKRVLNALPVGAEIKFAGPSGDFILHEDIAVPAVMIAGGIGITPFYSMIKQATLHHSTQKLTLFYGNQTLDHAAFLDELMSMQKENPHFRCIPTLAYPPSSWQGETGYITSSLIKKYAPNLATPIFYLCGSPAMVNALQETLLEMGIEQEKIRSEDFPGY
jgi:ferredoxin-NADP reductase